jgi:hypothetical protein
LRKRTIIIITTTIITTPAGKEVSGLSLVKLPSQAT